MFCNKLVLLMTIRIVLTIADEGTDRNDNCMVLRYAANLDDDTERTDNHCKLLTMIRMFRRLSKKVVMIRIVLTIAKFRRA